ncbi:MAG: hypothetical protein AAFY41_12595 [Bacteroidota bacterium]
MDKKGRMSSRNDESKRHKSYDNMDVLFKNQAETIDEAQSDGGALSTAISEKKIMTGGYLWTSKGLITEGAVSEEDWRFTGEMLQKIDNSIQWLIGDWVNFGAEFNYGDREDFAQKLGFKLKTIYEYSHVARNVEISIRMENLSFGHHQLVSGMKPKKQKEFLQQAVDNKWSISQLRKAIRGNDGDEFHLDNALNKLYSSQSSKARHLIKQGVNREVVAQIYEKIAEDIRNNK